MSGPILVKTYEDLPINKREILRYAGCKDVDESVLALLEDCLAEIEGAWTYKVCYGTFELTVEGDFCDLGVLRICSKDLAKNLAGCCEVVLFAATVGVVPDRLIARYSRLSPAKALMFQAIGAERVEALCDAFCAEMGGKKPRFSPGYGDLSMVVQKEIVGLLDCSKRIGVTLNESLLMSPTKSVTALMGR